MTLATLKILLAGAIMSYMGMYMIFGRQEVPEYSPAQWWPSFQEFAFFAGPVILALMAVFSRHTRSSDKPGETDENERQP